MSGLDLSTLSEGQRRIVTTLDRPLFVEAGAGSGKTFTLTRRIAWALSEGSGPYLEDLSQLLVITFTDAAAREIKDRVRSTLRAAGMRDAALQVDGAWISTIHGMCSRILHRHALDLGLDPEFGVASTNQEAELRHEALLAVVGEAARQRGSDPALARLFSTFEFGATQMGGYSGVMGIVDAISSRLGSDAASFESLVIPEPADVSELVGRVLNAVESVAAAPRVTPAAMSKLMSALESLRGFFDLTPGERDVRRASDLLAALALPSAAGAIKELVKEAKSELSAARLELALAACRPEAQTLVLLARAAAERYVRLKRQAGLLDNNDLVTLALAAVSSNPEVARDYAGRFRLVMVDEFQDTDDEQLELINLLSGGGQALTTVGDAQQSIYRFRGADVGVFYRRSKTLGQQGCLRLNTNYRSHREVLSLVDCVCGGDAGVLDGFMHLDFDPARKDCYEAAPLPRINVELVSGKRGTGEQGRAVLALAVADRLAKLRDAGQRPGGMALLLGSTTHAALYIDALRARGIDCVVTGGSTFTQASEVAAMAALLHTLANPHDTQSGLFPLLSSGMFDLTADDFVQLGTRPQHVLDAPTKRGIDRGLETMELYGARTPSRRLRRAFDLLSKARLTLRGKPVADVCMQLLRESGWLARLEAQGPQGQAQEANLLAAVGYIRDLCSGMGLGPVRAAQEFDIWLEKSKIPPASLAGGEMNSLRIMTVHASKGLEFPVVALAECWSDPRPARQPLMGRGEDGKTVMVLAPSGLSGLDVAEGCGESPRSLGEWHQFLKERERQGESAEKTRVLYVGLTRAKECLVVGLWAQESSKGLTPQLAARSIDALFGFGMPAVGERSFSYGGQEEGLVRSCRVDKSGDLLVADSASSLPAVDGELPSSPAQTCALGGICTQAAQDDFTHFAVEPDGSAAQVVSRRAREGVFSYSSAHAQMDEGPAPLVPSVLVQQGEMEAPAAPEDGDRATSLGSAFHELAQVMVESGQVFPSSERIAAAKRYWRLSPRAQARLDEALARWWGSELRARTLSFELQRAELPFFVKVDSRYGSHVEGAIDLLASSPSSREALLVDYKTGDRGLGLEEIRSRHEMQANFYAHVLLGQGFSRLCCAFVCVELDAKEFGGTAGQPVVVSYDFDEAHPPVMP